MKWFKHESGAHSDAKLEKVLMRYGAEGYGLYWYCIELIAGKVSGENITFELEHDAEILGFRLKIDSLRVEEIMRFMISLGLFESSGKTITCIRIAKSLDERWTKSEELKKVIRGSEDLLQNGSRGLPLDKKRRDKKRKDNSDSGRFAPPTLDEAFEYFKERGCNDKTQAERFIDFYESKGWVVGKSKMKDWRASVRNWLQGYKPAQEKHAGLDF